MRGRDPQNRAAKREERILAGRRKKRLLFSMGVGKRCRFTFLLREPSSVEIQGEEMLHPSLENGFELGKTERIIQRGVTLGLQSVEGGEKTFLLPSREKKRGDPSSSIAKREGPGASAEGNPSEVTRKKKAGTIFFMKGKSPPD